MLGARIDVIQPQIRNLIAYLLPLPEKYKKLTTVVKRDKTSGLDRNDRQNACVCSAHFLSERFNKVLSFVVMGVCKDFLHHDYVPSRHQKSM